MLKHGESLIPELKKEVWSYLEIAAEWGSLSLQRIRTLTGWASVSTYIIPNLYNVKKDNQIYAYGLKLPFSNNQIKYPFLLDKALDTDNFRTYAVRLIHQAALFRFFIPRMIYGIAIDSEEFEQKQIEELKSSVNSLSVMQGRSIEYGSLPDFPLPYPLSSSYISTINESLSPRLEDKGLNALASGFLAKILFDIEGVPEEKRNILIIGLKPEHREFIDLVSKEGWKVVGINHQRAYYINENGFDLSKIFEEEENLQHLSRVAGTRVINPASFFSIPCTLALGLERRPLVLEGAMDRLQCKYLFCNFQIPIPREEYTKLYNREVYVFPYQLFPSNILLYYHLSCMESLYGITFSNEAYKRYLYDIISDVFSEVWFRMNRERFDLATIAYLLAWERMGI
jgi:hypothetical protein